MTYATNRGLVWVLDNVKKRGSGGGSHTSSLTTGLGSGPSSLQLPSGPPMSLTPQGNENNPRKNYEESNEKLTSDSDSKSTKTFFLFL